MCLRMTVISILLPIINREWPEQCGCLHMLEFLCQVSNPVAAIPEFLLSLTVCLDHTEI